eukprot:scaffold188715_cov44-Tisochrysis_lutea.AAC.1
MGTCHLRASPSYWIHIELACAVGGAKGRKCSTTGAVTSGRKDCRGRFMWYLGGGWSVVTSSGASENTVGMQEAQLSRRASSAACSATFNSRGSSSAGLGSAASPSSPIVPAALYAAEIKLGPSRIQGLLYVKNRKQDTSRSTRFCVKAKAVSQTGAFY